MNTYSNNFIYGNYHSVSLYTSKNMINIVNKIIRNTFNKVVFLYKNAVLYSSE